MSDEATLEERLSSLLRLKEERAWAEFLAMLQTERSGAVDLALEKRVDDALRSDARAEIEMIDKILDWLEKREASLRRMMTKSKTPDTAPPVPQIL